MHKDYEKVTEGYWTKLLTGARPEVESRVRSDMHRLPGETTEPLASPIGASCWPLCFERSILMLFEG